ncbi:hypothetical protein BGZ94_001253, partial [Podila epigama]
MPTVPRVFWAILAVLVAVLAAGMLYNDEGSLHEIKGIQHEDTFTSFESDSSPSQCNNPSGMIGDSSCCHYETVGKLNVDFSAKLQEIVSMPFFRYFKLFGSFPSKPVMKDQDFCVPDTDTDEVYVDLKDNPERFTGYSGPSAASVWKAIYEENCFDVSKEMTAGCQTCQDERRKNEKERQDPDQKQQSILSPPEPAPMEETRPTEKQMHDIFSKVPKGKGELQSLIQDISKNVDEESCIEKRVYYRLISGLHASISIHICDEWFNQTTGEWGPNLDCFISRVGLHPERLENIYFDYVVLLRAVTKVSDYLAGYEYCTGDDTVDKNIMTVIHELVDLVKKCPPTFDEKLLFRDSASQDTKQLKNQFRDHFRNVTRIMDCVGCEKCRLWGKVQTLGLGTALKILFSYDDDAL